MLWQTPAPKSKHYYMLYIWSLTSKWPIGVVVITLPSQYQTRAHGSGRGFNPLMSHSLFAIDWLAGWLIRPLHILQLKWESYPLFASIFADRTISWTTPYYGLLRQLLRL